ncbi:hypothetical protein Srubr_18280 [Streptomyces rubradiris]|uniref:Uncharacterized protein n=1 Tax=Streptomyces rubradiris TaxID=285531 RepID=A0ABQ3R804_STRRR|nr:hypothetical protein Srubr_18280 [Streptomyces rubradiris]
MIRPLMVKYPDGVPAGEGHPCDTSRLERGSGRLRFVVVAGVTSGRAPHLALGAGRHVAAGLRVDDADIHAGHGSPHDPSDADASRRVMVIAPHVSVLPYASTSGTPNSRGTTGTALGRRPAPPTSPIRRSGRVIPALARALQKVVVGGRHTRPKVARVSRAAPETRRPKGCP